MPVNKWKEFFIIALLLLFPKLLYAQNAYESGVGLFIEGNLEGATTSFAEYFAKNTKKNFAKNIFANCLIIEAKEAIYAKKYATGYKALIRAHEIFPKRKGLKALSLIAELEGLFFAGNQSAPIASLNSESEMNSIFDQIFANDIDSSKRKDYLIHIVKDGDTMSSLAIKYYNNYILWEKIWKRNKHIRNPHRLEDGTRLIIPLP